MDFENYAQRIVLINYCYYFEKSTANTKQTARLSVRDGKM